MNQPLAIGICRGRMRDASIVLLLLFTTVASVDGFYFHIHKYRLYARPDSRLEHLLHSINALLLPVTLAPLYLAQATGAWLWLAAGATVLTFGSETFDVFIEKRSRASLGGLTSLEYWMHFFMGGLRWAFSALIFATVPVNAWMAPTSWSWTVPTLNKPLEILVWGITVVGLPVGLLHVLLALQGRPRRIAESALLVRSVAAP